ncbi:hypothetical protein PDIG_06410 [Penicillium digitatum PHI26]|uniref:Uncharacterized protein n=2 Tax=Penicillium digitatum TaxID=36651 RepID=K9H1F5_PEND2|nr:hypothetical protein PDIP_11080 [Penicillium digitatum Pd1]EKV18926.1 hypothetical protein PDIG_06410 [Penicillium digitatum PHI26]EKV20976.1 hypothetical protein PDIP_11080 [Penicillium digitatum Pd1]
MCFFRWYTTFSVIRIILFLIFRVSFWRDIWWPRRRNLHIKHIFGLRTPCRARS